MLKKIILCLVVSTFLSCFQTVNAKPDFKGQAQKIPSGIQKKIMKVLKAQQCPISFDELRYLTLTYWGFDGRVHQGTLIVNHELAQETLEIFHELFELRFPINQMKPIHMYGNDDMRSMSDNNTSSYNCRQITGQNNLFSQHAFGRAIDINPLQNPYVKGEVVLPTKGRPYANRNKRFLGKINKNSSIYKIFIQKGWQWGGDWCDVQDYQHFEKRAGGEIRDPKCTIN